MTESTDETADTRRRRAVGGRSRAGCLTCKQRHVRCDEQRPSWYAFFPFAVRLALTVLHLLDLSRVSSKLSAANSYCTSMRCLRINKSCEYISFRLPLQDRRQQYRPLLPGQQAPWVLKGNNQASWRQLTFGTDFDAFDSLPVRMQFNSKELFHYCELNSLIQVMKFF